DQLVDSLMAEIEKTLRWGRRVTFLDAKQTKTLDAIYILLDIYMYPRRIRATETESPTTIPFDQLLSISDSHCVLLGQAGAGKTTSMKRLATALLCAEAS